MDGRAKRGSARCIRWSRSKRLTSRLRIPSSCRGSGDSVIVMSSEDAVIVIGRSGPMQVLLWLFIPIFGLVAVCAFVAPILAVPMGWYGHVTIIERVFAFAAGFTVAAAFLVFAWMDW